MADYGPTKLVGGISVLGDGLKRKKGFLSVFDNLFRRTRRQSSRKTFHGSTDTGLVSAKIPPIAGVRKRCLSLDNIVSSQKKPKGTWLYVEDVILTDDDRNDLISGKCLNDDIVHAAQLLLKRQFPHINGFQDPNCAPVKTGQSFTCPLVFDAMREPCSQIHHNGRNHWIASIKDSCASDIHILDSAYEKGGLTPSLKIQLSQIYTRDRSHVHVPHVPQQLNKYDCGIYAIAFLTEYCFNQYLGGAKLKFKTKKLRSHLLMCLYKGKMSPFPKL